MTSCSPDARYVPRRLCTIQRLARVRQTRYSEASTSPLLSNWLVSKGLRMRGLHSRLQKHSKFISTRIRFEQKLRWMRDVPSSSSSSSTPCLLLLLCSFLFTIIISIIRTTVVIISIIIFITIITTATTPLKSRSNSSTKKIIESSDLDLDPDNQQNIVLYLQLIINTAFYVITFKS